MKITHRIALEILRRTSLATFRTTGAVVLAATDGDTTTWTHAPYTGNSLSKTYATFLVALALRWVGWKGEGCVVGGLRTVCGGVGRFRAAVEEGVRVDEDFARAGTACRADHAALLEEIHDAGCVVVADAHAALEV